MPNFRKSKRRSKPPSRQRYEAEHPTISFRLDRETHERLQRHLDGTERSFADFVKDALGREESTVEKGILAREAAQFEDIEYRLRFLEDLVRQILLDSENDVFCPQCFTQLVRCSAQLIELEGASVLIHACPACCFFTDTSLRVNPKTIEWLERER